MTHELGMEVAAYILARGAGHPCAIVEQQLQGCTPPRTPPLSHYPPHRPRALPRRPPQADCHSELRAFWEILEATDENPQKSVYIDFIHLDVLLGH
jgi:hypothetical protein